MLQQRLIKRTVVMQEYLLREEISHLQPFPKKAVKYTVVKFSFMQQIQPKTISALQQMPQLPYNPLPEHY